MKTLPVILFIFVLSTFCACQQNASKKPSSDTTSHSSIETVESTEETEEHFPETVDPLLKHSQGNKLDLPEYANNGGTYVRYNNATYYRQYNADSYEKSGLGGYPAEIPGIKKKMMRMDADGSTHMVFEDEGNGSFFIDSKGYFYLKRLLSTEDTDKYQVYAHNSSGELIWISTDDYGKIYALDEKRNVLICIDSEPNYRIHALDCSTGKRTLIAKSNNHMTPLLYDNAGGFMYYAESDVSENKNGENYNILNIYRVDCRGGNLKKITTVPVPTLKGDIEKLYEDGLVQQFNYIDIKNSYKSGNHLYIFGAEYQGSGHYYSSGALIRVNINNGSWDEITPEKWNPADWYGINSPTYYATDGPFWQGEEKYDYVIYPDYDLKAIDVLTKSETDNLGWIGTYSERKNNEDYNIDWSYRFISDVFYSGKDIWFSVKDSDYDSERAIGWRSAYKIKHTSVYRKSGISGKIELIYEY